MSLLNALILGLIQGVAEFLPISSSGHLSIAQNLLGLGVEGADDMFFDVLLHLGTLAAVFAAYWSDIREMVLEFIRTIRDATHGGMPEHIPPARRLILLIIVGTLPLFLVLPVQDFVEGLSANTYFVGAALLVTGVLLHLGTLAAVFAAYWSDIREMVLEFIRTIRDATHGGMPEHIPPARRLILLIIVGTLPLFLVLPVQDFVEGLSANTYFVGAALLVTGVLLMACDRVKKGRKNERTATIKDVLLVGVGQAIATCPGISRSGMTITVGCFVGFDRKFAVRFAFLLSIPAVLGANILHIADAVKAGIDWALLPAYLLGVAVAAVSGYFCIRLLKMIAAKGKFGAFSYYCWIAGGITLLLSVLKSLELLHWPWMAV